MFQSNIAKAALAGLFGAGLIGGFVVMNLGGESATCHDNGYGDYNDALGTCEITGDYANNLVIVAGNTANTPVPTISKNTKTYDFLKNSVAQSADIQFISVAPDLQSEKIEIARNETNDAQGFVDSVDQAINTINTKLSQAPTMNGATYFEAISKAARALASASSSQASTSQANSSQANASQAQATTGAQTFPTIIILGSGLSDGGLLNFADYDLLLKEPAEVISALSKSNQLVNNLNNINIIWSGLGETVAPQSTLSNLEVENLKSIYRQALLRSGANLTSDALSGALNASTSVANNPYTVKTTKVSQTSLVFEFSDEQLTFESGTANLKDQNQAIDTLTKVVDTASSNPARPITITGYVAPEDCSGRENSDLAHARANKVSQLLQSMGVANSITTKSGGIYQPEVTVCDHDNWNETVAESKRKVIINFN